MGAKKEVLYLNYLIDAEILLINLMWNRMEGKALNFCCKYMTIVI